MATVSDEAMMPRRGVMREGWRIQRRVIAALMMRELHTRYGRENIGYLWLFLEPMMLATIIGLLHSKAASHFGSDIKPVPLALIGYCNFMTFRGIVNRGEGAIEGNLSLLYHRTISIFDILVSRALLESAATGIAFAVLIGLATAVGVSDPPARPLFLLVGMALMLLLSFSVGMVVAGATHDNRALGRLVHPMSYVMMPLSGAFFTMEMLPKEVRELLLYIPLAHIFEILRYGWFESATIEYVDSMYIAEWIGISLLLGLLLISVARKRIHMA